MQQFLGLELSSDEELTELSLDELQSLATELQDQFQERG